MSKLIKGGTVVTADLTTKADVFVQHDKIVAVGPDLDHAADHVFDASGCYVMPGGIDPHTHMEMPFMGTFSSDDFDTGTAAALSGGTTMIVDFCLPAPQQGLLDALQQWYQKAGKARSDYSFHMAITWWDKQVFDEMPKVVEQGVNTFKHFMAYKGALMVDDDEMFASFSRCAEIGALPLVHAENGDVVAALQQKLLAEGNNGPEAHAYSRPPEVEGEAVNRAVMIADQAGVPLYVVHVSCEQAHEAIRRARQKGMRVYGEPLIQHLVLDESEYANPDWDHAARRVMSPPFRDKLNQDSLWAGLASGSLQVVATDHCAFTTKQKRMGRKRLHQDPERHRRNGGPALGAVDLWRQDRAADDERVRRRHLDQHRQDPEHLSAQGRDHARRRRRHRRLGPGGDQDDQRQDAEIGDRLQRLRGHLRYRTPEDDAFARPHCLRGRRGEGRHRRRAVHRAAAERAGRTSALSTWKELTAPRKVERSGIPAGV